MATVYDVLGLAPTADYNEIKKAYREKARASHPDRGGDEAEFKKIGKVWELLDTKAKAQLYFEQFSAQAIKPDWTSSHASYQPGASSYRTPSPTQSSSSTFFAQNDIPENPKVSKFPLYQSVYVLMIGGFGGFFKHADESLMARLISINPLLCSPDPLDKKLAFALSEHEQNIWPGASDKQLDTAFKGILSLLIQHADLHSATDNKKYFCLNQLAELVGKQVRLEHYHTVLAEYARPYVTVDSVALLMAMERQSEPSSSVPLLD